MPASFSAAHLAGVSRALVVSVTAASLGAVFAFGLYNIWDLEKRWFVVAIGAVLGISAAMLLVRVFSDFVLVFTFFAIPFASFTKWFWPAQYAEDERGQLVYAGVLGVGLLDFILVGLYLSWFYRAFVLRERPPPGWFSTDWFLLAFLIVHLLASLGAMDFEAALGSTEYLARYVLLYFYISRNFAPRHIPWLLAAVCFVVILEAALGSIQFTTGKLLGIALDKGAGTSEIDFQYSVPGIETYKRATGTSYDSHALGNVIGMLLPFPLVLALAPGLRLPMRAVFAAMTLLAVLAIFVTLSRAAWLSSVIALGIGLGLIVAVWRERYVIPVVIATALAILAVLPFLGGFIYDRFANSPHEVLTTRYDQYEVALRVVSLYPIFGVGPGNWMRALQRHDFLWLEVLPPHNVVLWIMAETGVLGVACYIGVLTTTMVRLINLIRARHDMIGRLAMSTLLALISSVLVGLTDPTYREPNAWTLFWILIALSVALSRMSNQQRSPMPPIGSAGRSLVVA